MATVGELLQIFTMRLELDRRGITTWPSPLRASVERFVENLKSIEPDEKIVVDADIDRDHIARFVRVSTGEVIGEINKWPDIYRDP